MPLQKMVLISMHLKVLLAMIFASLPSASARPTKQNTGACASIPIRAPTTNAELGSIAWALEKRSTHNIPAKKSGKHITNPNAPKKVIAPFKAKPNGRPRTNTPKDKVQSLKAKSNGRPKTNAPKKTSSLLKAKPVVNGRPRTNMPNKKVPPLKMKPKGRPRLNSGASSRPYYGIPLLRSKTSANNSKRPYTYTPPGVDKSAIYAKNIGPIQFTPDSGDEGSGVVFE